MDSKLLAVVNTVRAHKNLPEVELLMDSQQLREDLGFDSLDLAELTARIDEQFGVDIFSGGIVRTVGEVRALLPQSN